jgi:putative NADPH-quinone reductase
MAGHITIIQGHPDPASERFCRALGDAYASGARESGLEIRVIDVAQLGIPFLRTQAEFETGKPPAAIVQAQEVIAWADHLLIIYPLWLGTMPAMLKGFFEQAFRPGFAFKTSERGWSNLLNGRSARIVVTMGCRPLSTAGISVPTVSRAWSAASCALSASSRSARP